MAQPVIAPVDPVLAFFQEVKAGDLRKQEAQSNDAATGGGARDLRMPSRFWDSVSRLFPTEVSERERGGIIFSQTDTGTVHENIYLHRPTDARPGEIRIGKIHTIEGWAIEPEWFQAELQNNNMLFYLLTLDVNGRAWARVMASRYLAENRPDFAAYVRQRIGASGRTVRGVFDFSGGNHYPM